MNARLAANVLRDWKPGWRTGVREHIAATSNIPKRRRKSNADVYLIGLALLGIAVAVVVYG